MSHTGLSPKRAMRNQNIAKNVNFQAKKEEKKGGKLYCLKELMKRLLLLSFSHTMAGIHQYFTRNFQK
jgi:hypothetical protein